MRRFWLLGIVVLAGFVWVGSASAHHSVQAEFDVHKTFTISGTIAKIEFINPHSYLTINVKDANGNVQQWAFEIGGAALVRRATRGDSASLFPGVQVTATGLSSRDGSNRGYLEELKLSNGKVFKFNHDDNGN